MTELESRARQLESVSRRIGLLDDRDEITRLNHRYTRLIDTGRLEEFAELFAHGTWRDCTGAAAVLDWLRTNVRLYAGTPRTNHLISALDIEIDGDTATGLSTITVYFQHPDATQISVITVNDYFDEYRRIDDRWQFASRRVSRRLEGDMTEHVVDQTR